VDDGHGALNPFRYTGRESDETGDYYYRARYYDPGVGRFISEDPIRLLGGINLYSYVDSVGKTLTKNNAYLYTGNSPINRIDPLGLDYLDLNVSIGLYGIGITGGMMFDSSGVYPYLGGGLTTPGISLTRAPGDVPTRGWNVGLQGAFGLAGQGGYSFGNEGDWFYEYGIGYPGASLTGFYVWGPFLEPRKSIQPAKCH
jgi:RHS repeat-associated protein